MEVCLYYCDIYVNDPKGLIQGASLPFKYSTVLGLLSYNFAMVNDCPFLVSSALEDAQQICAI